MHRQTRDRRFTDDRETESDRLARSFLTSGALVYLMVILGVASFYYSLPTMTLFFGLAAIVFGLRVFYLIGRLDDAIRRESLGPVDTGEPPEEKAFG